MAKIKKTVLAKPNSYSVMRPGGRREMEAISAERMKKWAENGNALIKSGARIPAPFNHSDPSGHYPHPVLMGEDGGVLDASTGQQVEWDVNTNGGYIEEFSYTPEEGLTCMIDAPGDENDYNSPAGKILHTAKESSIFVKDTYTDGSGKVWKDVPVHVAHVLFPRESGQPDPQLIRNEETKGAMAFSMSDAINTSDLNPNIDPNTEGDNKLQQVIDLLNANFIALPEDTTLDTLLDNLIIALGQKQASKAEQQAEEAGLTQQPEGSQAKTPGVVMSDINQETLQKKVDSFLMSQTLHKKESLKERIEKLQEKGVITAERAKILMDELANFSIALSDINDDGTVSASTLESRLEDLESVPSPFEDATDDKPPASSEVLEPPADGSEEELSPEDYDEILKESGAFA